MKKKGKSKAEKLAEVRKHLHGDIKGFKKEADEDRELLRKLKNPRKRK